jgi:hypothetical protein
VANEVPKSAPRVQAFLPGIRTIAERWRKPQSVVVREAVAVFAARELKLDEAERARRLHVFDELATKPRTRPQADVNQALRRIRLGRRAGWRRTSD